MHRCVVTLEFDPGPNPVAEHWRLHNVKTADFVAGKTCRFKEIERWSVKPVTASQFETAATTATAAGKAQGLVGRIVSHRTASDTDLADFG